MISYSFILPYFERPIHLLKTLESYQELYYDKNVEVLIVDDCSSMDKTPIIPKNFSIPVKILRVNDKNGINPCVPYNIGARQAMGEILVLTSPEVVHTSSIFEQKHSLNAIRDNKYLIFSVFALSGGALNEKMLDTKNYLEFQEVFNCVKDQLQTNLGLGGYKWANQYGSWYSHSKYRKTDLNFLSAISKKNFYELSGFDERFRKGAGYDDIEFSQRLKKIKLNFEYLDETMAIHLDHEIVTERKEFKIDLNSNKKLFRKSRFLRYKFNNTWGKTSYTLTCEKNY